MKSVKSENINIDALYKLVNRFGEYSVRTLGVDYCASDLEKFLDARTDLYLDTDFCEALLDGTV